MAKSNKIDSKIKFLINQIVYTVEGYHLEDFEILKTKVKDINNENGVIWYKLEDGDIKRNIDCIFGTLEEAYAFICERISAIMYSIGRNYKRLKKEGENNEI